jgi:hypothetical protein
MCRRIQVTRSDIYYKIYLIHVNIFKYIFYIVWKSFVSRPIVARLGTGQQRNCGPFAGRDRHSVQKVWDVTVSDTKRSERDADHFTAI